MFLLPVKWQVDNKNFVAVPPPSLRLQLEMSKVVPVPPGPGPGPGPELFFLPGPGPGPGPKFFLTRTSTKIFFWTEAVTKIFLTGALTQKFVSDGTRTKTLNFFSPGPRPGPKLFFHRNRDQIFFLTGTKNDWSRSCLLLLDRICSKCIFNRCLL
jgi:hypothetical protein